MTTIGGLVFLLACVFGGYVLAGGKFDIILHALPHEMLTIGGAAIGAFVMANSIGDIKHVAGGFGKIMKGARYKKADYIEMLSLLYFFVRLAQTKGAMALEPHIEKPEESSAFGKFPKTNCSWFANVNDGKFVFLNSGKPITGELIGDPAALAANASGTASATTTTAAAP